MGLTVSLALLVALTAGSDTAPHSKLDVLIVVWGTTIGLALSHWFALFVSTRLTAEPDETTSALELLISQTAMAAVVAATATIPVLVLSNAFDRLGARLTAALFMGVLVAMETRRSRLSATHRLLICGAVTLIGLAVAAAKWYIGR
ncbi:MAG TPA: hypothetical protein VFN21_02460 [Acidimicrobiales bacterium]|nr:hypothetical protein [Acidimicrobiales bacterium]